MIELSKIDKTCYWSHEKRECPFVMDVVFRGRQRILECEYYSAPIMKNGNKHLRCQECLQDEIDDEMEFIESKVTSRYDRK